MTLLSPDSPPPASRQPGRLQTLLSDGEEGLGICVEPGRIPAFLLEANQRLQEGRIGEVGKLLDRPRLDSVETLCRQDPTRTDAMYILAHLLMEIGRTEEAQTWYLQILEHDVHAFVYRDLAHICSLDSRRTGEMTRYYEKSLEADPTDATAMASLGRGLMLCGRPEEGLAWFEQAHRAAPEIPGIHDMYLWNMHYKPGVERSFFFREYAEWGRRHAPVAPRRTPHRNRPDPDRCLRVGFISPDFCGGPVARSFEPLLDGVDRTTMRLHGYANVRKPDEVTTRFAGKFDLFRNIHAQHHAEVADQIEDDGIDILLEVAGHCMGNCLGVLAYRPAPVQVDYGGISTSGMAQIDYRLTDETIDPPETLQYYTETSLYLPGGLLSFAPPQDSPPVAEQPAARNGYVTFGSFNNNLKISPEVLALWARILRATPDARMVLKFSAGDDAGVRAHYYRLFEAMGVSRDRLLIRGLMPFGDYLRFLSEVDIALDTYPYNGCITTLDALWMGVPVVTLTGDTFVSRWGLSILSRLGLEVFAAPDEQAYVEKACGFAGQIPELQQIRSALRGMMLHSPLCDPVRLAREVQGALRTMWHHWCDEPRVSAATPINSRVTVG
ncbi:MAG: hypothetical protein IH892_17840, partial [Planctomycetes bacterium]|nr:hypothetical protein [Planctomycetota bacterium]